jgi:glyoxylate reductase
MAKPCIYVTVGRLPPHLISRLEAACEVRYREGPRESAEEFIARVQEVDGVLCPAPEIISPECLAACSPRLRVVSNFGVGYDNIDLDLATQHGVLVCNTPGVLNAAVADFTVGLILDIARRISESDRFVRSGQWGTSTFPLGRDLAGKTLGIVGLGRIGREVADRARPFGFRIVYADTVTTEGVEFQRLPLSELLMQADFVTLHPNLSPSTRGLIGARELALMKPSAYLINTSRGPVVDWPALRAALLEGRIAGAALDVSDPEPPDRDDPVLQLPNVVVTPHIASGTIETREAMAELAVTNLLEALAGRRPPHLVNAAAWREG